MSQFGRMSLSSNQTTLGVYFEKKTLKISIPRTFLQNQKSVTPEVGGSGKTSQSLLWGTTESIGWFQAPVIPSMSLFKSMTYVYHKLSAASTLPPHLQLDRAAPRLPYAANCTTHRHLTVITSSTCRRRRERR